MEGQLYLIILLPLLGFLLNGILGRRFGDRFVSVVGCLAPIGAFLVTWSAWSEIRGEEAAALHQVLFDWIHIAVGERTLHAPMALLFDHLSSLMCLVVTGVGSLIHLYSTGYMRGDKSYARFFAYLNLFTAFMLVLVLGDNLLLLFVGWEGVGLCSYLLIGFWHQDSANCDAGRKAFLFNRVGDFGFLIGVFLLFALLGTIDTREIAARVQELAAGSPDWTLTIAPVTLITLCLFVGATGKSAQIPLYPWLPDAMAGPTPVSALIHAATMVTSGVYMCCRLAPLFAASETTSLIVTGIGACTALLAGLIALGQNDIKKVLAYSTVSQLGYMFYAVGVGAFTGAMFHLVTHAFFKALLFLGSGSVIHAMHHEQDMRKMGGLRRNLPFTHLIFLIGTLAISGVPLFSGFFSKDEILFGGYFQAFASGHGLASQKVFWILSFVTAALTAFYMLRLVALTFWGESRVEESLAPRVQEPGGWMPVSLFLLALLSIFGGALNIPNLGMFTWLAEPERLADYLALPSAHAGVDHEALHHAELQAMLLSVAAGLVGLALAAVIYLRGRRLLAAFVGGIGRPLARLSERKFYVDELYHMLFIAPFQWISYILWVLVDRILIDGMMVGGSALVVRGTGEFFRRMQSGFLPAYLLTFGCGAVVLLVIMASLL